MDKKDLVRIASRKTGYSQGASEAIINVVIDTICESLKSGQSVQILDFGTFEVKERAPRMGRNPRKNEAVPIPARKLPNFRAAAKLRKSVEFSKI